MYPYNPIGYDPMFAAQMPDSYSNPLNFGAAGINPAQAGWSINSSYLTPSFMAGYRPGYMGSQNMGMPPMSFGRAAITAIPSPFQPSTPLYVDPTRYRQRATNEFTSYLGDGPMALAQMGIPIAVGLAAQGAMDSIRISGGAQRHLQSLAYNYRRLAPGFLGGVSTSQEAAYLARSQTLFEAAGHYMGAGLGRGLGHGASGLVRVGTLGMVRGVPGLGAAMGTAGAFAGAAFGSAVLPFMAGAAVTEGVNQAMFAPYVHGSATSNVLQESLDGTYTGLGMANAPLGISSSAASRIGFAATRGITDQTFDQSAAAPMLGYGMQSGLYKNMVMNKESIVSRTREIAQSVKLMMQVFNDPSIQDAIQRLGQLATSGGATGMMALSSLSRGYSVASAMSGIGTRELMGTYGNQGRFMYTQAGLTPYLGDLASMNAITGFSAAARTGLVSAESMAAMGGLGGMTQLSLEGQLGLARSPYNYISAFNSYALGGSGGGIAGNLSRFGNFMSRNPVAGYGAFILNRNEALSAQLSQDPWAFLSGIKDQADLVPGIRNRAGKYDAGGLASLMSARGMSPEQIRAMLIQLQSESDPKTLAQIRGAERATLQSDYAAMLERNNLTNYGRGFGLGSIGYMWNDAKVGISNWGSENFAQPIRGFFSSISDALTNSEFMTGNAATIGRGTPYGSLSEADWSKGMRYATPSSKFNPYRRNMLMGYQGRFNEPSSAMMGRLASSATLQDMPASMQATLSSLAGMASSNPGLKVALSRAGSMNQMDIATVANAMGGSLRDAQEAMSYYATQGPSGAVVTSDPYSSVVNTFRNTLFSAAKFRFEGGVTGSFSDESQRFASLGGKIRALSEGDLSVLSGFAQMNMSSLASNEAFLTALRSPGAGGAEMEAVLKKLGFNFDTTYGTGAEKEATLAREFVNAALVSMIASPESAIFGAATMKSYNGKTLRMGRSQLQKGMSTVAGSVERASLGKKELGPAAKLSAGELATFQGKAQQAFTKEFARSMGMSGGFGGQIDFSSLEVSAGALNGAATALTEAATALKNAAPGSGTPGVNPDGSQKNLTPSSSSADKGGDWSIWHPYSWPAFKK